MDQEFFAYVNDYQGSAAGADGPLAGMRLTIQPNLSARGWPTEAGSVALERFVAIFDAAAVQRLRAAGASLVGSTRMSELGFGLAGEAAGAAWSAGACDAAVVTDTLGEARYAAASAGAVGFKPSYGVCSRFGLIGLVPSMECLGLVVGSVRQAARVMAALAGPDERDFSMLTEGIPDFTQVKPAGNGRVVGVVRESLDALDRAEAEAVRQAVSRAEALGVRGVEVSLPEFELFPAVHNVIGSAEASSSAGKYDGVRYGHRSAEAEDWNQMYLRSRAESFGTLVKSYLFQGAYFQFENYAAFEDACRLRGRLIRRMQALFNDVNALAMPTRRAGADPPADAAAAATVEEVYEAFALTLPANVTGCPAVSLPGLVRRGEADLGLQLIGPHLGDVGLLSLADHLAGEAERGRRK